MGRAETVMLNTVVCGDALNWANSYDGPPFHAILCDPSYGWQFMSKEWDNDIALRPETWVTLSKPLYPGAFIMAFGGPRTYHRLACAMEDAGLILYPPIGWLQGQGFPKATRIDTQVDKAMGQTREVIGQRTVSKNLSRNGRVGDMHVLGEAQTTQIKVTIPATSMARAWEGHRYGLQALKPAIEFVAIAQKPWTGRRLDCILETGAGALNVDAGRIGIDPDDARAMERCNSPRSGRMYASKGRLGTFERSSGSGPLDVKQGRWPANFALCHVPPAFACEDCGVVYPIQPSIEVCLDCGGELEFMEGCKRVGKKRVKGTNISYDRGNIKQTPKIAAPLRERGQDPLNYCDLDGLETVDDFACVEGCPAKRLGEQSGLLKSGKMTAQHQRNSQSMYGQGNGQPAAHDTPGDKGTAVRFFKQADWEAEEWECSKDCPVAKLDEEAGECGAHGGLGNFQQHTWMMKNRSQNIKSSMGNASRFYHNSNWIHEIAERLATSDSVYYCPKASRRERQNGLDDFYWQRDKSSPTGFIRITKEKWESLPKRQRARGNIHPTVKPIKLLKWLAVLLLPPIEYAPRRIWVPFAGTGSEMIAAISVGWEEAVGNELLQDYTGIAVARIARARLEMAQMEMDFKAKESVLV